MLERDFDEEIQVGRKLLGAAIRARREALGVTRLDLAGVSGVAHDSLVSIELGRRTCSLSTLHRLAAGLGTTARDLLVGVYPWDGGTAAP